MSLPNFKIIFFPQCGLYGIFEILANIQSHLVFMIALSNIMAYFGLLIHFIPKQQTRTILIMFPQ